MAAQHILDSHIHLMPGFGMGGFSPTEYKAAVATSQSSIKVRSLEYPSLLNYSSPDSSPGLATKYQVDGFVYVETNRGVRAGKEIAQWASEPLKELAMLKRIVEGTPQTGEGTVGDGRLVKGIVAWAPIDRGFQTFQDYIAIAQKTAGKETWSRVKGFRFMLEMLFTEARFKTVLEDPQTIRTLASFGETWAFDVGVNTHNGGVWQLERAATFIEAVSKTAKTRFVISKST
jgi:L-rhamnono-1,4-lactonase